MVGSCVYMARSPSSLALSSRLALEASGTEGLSRRTSRLLGAVGDRYCGTGLLLLLPLLVLLLVMEPVEPAGAVALGGGGAVGTSTVMATSNCSEAAPSS